VFSGAAVIWPKPKELAARSTLKTKGILFMKYLRSQSLSDLDAEPPRVGVLELYSVQVAIPKETEPLQWTEVTTKGQGLVGMNASVARAPRPRPFAPRRTRKNRNSTCQKQTSWKPEASSPQPL
jgi:hypothetical protein